MADITITESGMAFGPFPEENILGLETCHVYRKIQHGMPMAEFSFLETKGKKRFFTIEAKSSSPKSENCKFDDYIKKVAAKLSNGFHLAHSLLLNRFGSDTTKPSNALKNINLANIEHRLVLVINKCFEESELMPIQDALRKELKNTEKIWKLGANSIWVMNKEMAKREGLIQ